MTIPTAAEPAARSFGHNANPVKDFCFEIEALQEIWTDMNIGVSTVPYEDFRRRIDRAMKFRPGDDPLSVHAKTMLRQLDHTAPVAATAELAARTCAKCGMTAVVFICSEKGCPENGGVAYPWTIYPEPAAPVTGERINLEPNEAMLVAARDWSLDRIGTPIGNDAARGVWRAMAEAWNATAAPPAPDDIVALVHDAIGLACSSARDRCAGGPGHDDKAGRAKTALLAAIGRMGRGTAGWQPVENAPHDVEVILGWWTENHGPSDPARWVCLADCASWGSRNEVASSISRHSQATHWQPLPPPPGAAPPPPPAGEPVVIDYTNHAGVRSVRTIIPTGRMLSGPSKWHPDAPWLIEAMDVAKGEMRTFDPARIHRWGAGEPVEPSPDALQEAHYCLEQLRRIQGWEDPSDADEEQSSWSVYQRTIEALEGFEQAALASAQPRPEVAGEREARLARCLGDEVRP